MKLHGWDNFLQHIAQDYQLKGRLKSVFLARFAYENWRKPDKQIWKLSEAASHETYKKQMTAVYAFFAQVLENSDPPVDLNGKGPGKFTILRDWLQETKYPEWKQSSFRPVSGQVPSFSFRTPVAFDSPFYVERPPIESDCCQQILQPGALIRIKAPEKMGKTLSENTIYLHR